MVTMKTGAFCPAWRKFPLPHHGFTRPIWKRLRPRMPGEDRLLRFVYLSCPFTCKLPPALLLVLSFSILAAFSLEAARTVVVYASQDQAYAEPILQDFTKRTGIKVRAVYDSEAVKTVGLANRLLAEH